MAKNKLALTLIVKATDDEAVYLDKALRSVAKYVDGIFINVNHKEGVELSQKVIDICNKYKAKVIHTVWSDNFADARNAVADIVPKEYNWILWIDTDDTVRKPKNLKKIMNNAGGIDAIYMNYLYDFDEYDNPITVHMSARLYRNNGTHRWKGRIHETLVETRAARTGMTEDVEVVHNATEDRRNSSLDRNIRLLEIELEENKKEPDARIMFYLAGSYIDAGRDKEANALLEEYVKVSGWDQERSQAYTQMGRIAKRGERLTAAKLNFLQAIGEAPDDPEPYVELGQLECELHNLEKALIWLNIALSQTVKPTVLVRNPQSVNYRANILAAEACLELGGVHIEKSIEYAEAARKASPHDKYVKEMIKDINGIISKKKKLKKIVDDVKLAKDNRVTILNILSKVPKDLDDNPLIVQLRAMYSPFRWPDKSIAIYTGETAIGEWGPWSLADGIGGSEEAIIRISKHLKDLGYKVVVFGTVGNRAGDYDGVQWRNHWECQLGDTFDIFVAWRNPFIFESKIKARKTYLWLHDVMDKGEFTTERLANIDKVILLSKYHRTCYPMIPEEKVLYSGNGIDAEEFDDYDGIERDPHKMVYQSSHVRGLQFLYEIWPDIKKAVPDATLDVYYGWYSYDKINAGNPERMAWKDRMVQQERSLDGVTDHGKVDQLEIVRAASGAGIWAYPTTFPEIYPVHGDTLIECLDGRHKIKDLVDKNNFPVYSCDKDGNLSISNVTGVFLTRKNTEMLKIGYVSGIGCKAKEIKYLTLTPDHEVMLKNGSYIQAQHLEVGDSLKAFHRQKNGHGKGYDHIGVTGKQVVAEHRFVASKFHGAIPTGYDVDHLDSNTANNHPDNLEIKTRSSHWKDTWLRKSELEKKEWTAKQREGIKRDWTDEGWSTLRSEAAKKMWDKRKALSNHKIVSIEKANNADAYCMEVEPDHNFVANGIFVHNCITAVKCQAAGAVPVCSDYAALDEMVQYGEKIPLYPITEQKLEHYKDRLIWWLQHPEEQDKQRLAMKEWARTLTWRNTAEGWIKDFEKERSD